MDQFQHNSAGYLANHMARLFAAGLARRIQPLGLAPAQFMVLLELWHSDGRTQADLTAALDVEQATMANTLKRMERDGLILRMPSEEDRRARARNALALAGLDEAERATFIALMRRVIGNMQRG